MHEGYLLLVYRNDLLYLDCNPFGINDETRVPPESRKGRLVEISVGQDQF